MDGSLTGFDLAGLAILLVSGLLALVRGFVREALSVTAFVAASLATLWSLPAFIGPAREIIDPDWLAPLAIGGVIFVIIYLAVTFVTSSLSKGLAKGEDVNVVDRSLGFAFGVLRGLVLLGLGVIFFAATFGEGGRPPGWVTEARIYPMVNATARALQSLAPETSRLAETDPLPEQRSGDDDPIADAIRNNDTSYGSRDRNGLDDLIDSTTDDQEDDG